MRPPVTCLLLLVGLVLGVHSSAAAQKKGKPAAFTDPASAGADFQAQGEYCGLLSGGFRRVRVGVQVIALGDGKFQAVEYPGGLPGDGWTGQPPARIDCQRDGAFVVIPAGRRFGTIMQDAIWYRDASSGRLLGMLAKSVRRSPTLGASPPAGAIVLFNGSNTDAFDGGRIEDGLLTEGATLKRPVQDFFLHLEFRTPFMPTAQGQARGNSGVYIQRRYEVQILDSFGLDGVFNECGSLYRQRPPGINMCLPPLSWQTYDIEFRAARFDGGKKVENARITVQLNGVPVQDNVELTNKTGAGKPEGPQPMPIQFQNHGNPVRYRNMWMIDRSGA